MRIWREGTEGRYSGHALFTIQIAFVRKPVGLGWQMAVGQPLGEQPRSLHHAQNAGGRRLVELPAAGVRLQLP